MEYILLVVLITGVTLKLSGVSLFRQATRSGWYPVFLESVVNTITDNHAPQKILDIGTGTGTLPRLLIEKREGMQVTGIDTDPAMIAEAKRRCYYKDVIFHSIRPRKPLPFADREFDAVTCCSVLFLLDGHTINALLKEAQRVLKPGGSILVLTPSGAKTLGSAIAEVWKYPFSWTNYTFLVWKAATTNRGRQWMREKRLVRYATDNRLKYRNTLTFNGNATLEILSN